MLQNVYKNIRSYKKVQCDLIRWYINKNTHMFWKIKNKYQKFWAIFSLLFSITLKIFTNEQVLPKTELKQFKWQHRIYEDKSCSQLGSRIL